MLLAYFISSAVQIFEISDRIEFDPKLVELISDQIQFDPKFWIELNLIQNQFNYSTFLNSYLNIIMYKEGTVSR